MTDTTQPAPAKPLNGMSVLIVDDDDVSLIYAGAILESGGAVVTSARSGEEGLAQASTKLFALLVIDLEMPGMGGQELLQKVRALGDRQKACAPVLVLSAGNATVQAGVLAAGATAFVSKPVAPEALIAAAVAAFAVVDNLDRQALRAAVAAEDVRAIALRIGAIRVRQPDLATALEDHLAHRDFEGLLRTLAAHKFVRTPTTGTLPAARFAISIGVQQAFRAAAEEELVQLVALQAEPEACVLRSVAHRLAGSAATFGHAAIGKQAREITRLLESTDDVDVAGLARTLERALRDGGFGEQTA